MSIKSADKQNGNQIIQGLKSDNLTERVELNCGAKRHHLNA